MWTKYFVLRNGLECLKSSKYELNLWIYIIGCSVCKVTFVNWIVVSHFTQSFADFEQYEMWTEVFNLKKHMHCLNGKKCELGFSFSLMV